MIAKPYKPDKNNNSWRSDIGYKRRRIENLMITDVHLRKNYGVMGNDHSTAEDKAKSTSWINLKKT